MADPHNKKVFSIFQPKSKPVPPTSTAESSPPNPSNSTPKASTSSSTSPEATIAPQNLSKPKRLAPAASKDSDCITLGSSDDEDEGSSSTAKSSSKRIKTSSGNVQKIGKGKGKGKARAVVVDSEEEDDLVVIKGLTPKKGMKDRDGKNRKAKGENGKKGKKAMESIDLTISPPRKSTSSSFKPSSSTSFAPLSDVYRHERERRKVNEGIEPRWPTAEEHGYFMSSPSTSKVADTAEPPRYPQRSIESEKGKEREVEEGFLERYGKSIEQDSNTPRFSPSSSRPSNYKDLPFASTSTLLPTYPSHPLLDRLATPLRSAQSNRVKADQAVQSELWTTKYGPKKAEEVLGSLSGGSAMILKEWLTEQKVEGGNEDENSKKRRRPVNRGVEEKKKKKRRSDDLDDFIASSSDDEQEPFDPLLYDEEGIGPPTLAPSSSSIFHNNIKNLILLVGPNGSGKTVAVHAVAQELGYEIFEVNAGMGKRRAKDIESEVGDVARNHIVRASPRKPGAKDFFAGFKSGTSKGKGKETESGAGRSGKGPTQSLILIEEVDVLYQGEDDFWAGIRSLADESHRPIILTCTDSSQIRFENLGLQKIYLPHLDSREPLLSLDFAAPESSLVIPYLQLIALSEDHILSTSSVEHLFESESLSSPNPAWLCRNSKERPLPHPFSSAPPASKDLRKAMMQLQFELQRRPTNDDDLKQDEKRWVVNALDEPMTEKTDSRTHLEGGDDDWLEKAARAADSLSFADAEVARKVETRIQDLDIGPFTTHSDLEQGLPVLEPPIHNSTRLPYMGQEPEITSSIESLAYQLNPEAPRLSDREDELLESKKLSYLLPLALLSTQFFYSSSEDLYDPHSPILPRPSLVTDYLPLYRHITSHDDERERLAQESNVTDDLFGGGRGAGVRRSTRVVGGSGKVKVKRDIEWSRKEDVEWVRQSGFEEV